MRFVRYVSLVDVVTTVMVLFVLVLPARTMMTAWAASGSPPERYALALSEARAISDGKDGALTSELSRRLGEAGFRDWAVEAAARGSVAAEGSPSRWRAYLATSVAYVERLDAVPALDYAKKALAACAAAREAAGDERACPSWEEVRMDLYARHLDAGVSSGIDARKHPADFRRAGEAALRTINIRPQPGSKLAPPAGTAPAPAGTAPAPAGTAPAPAGTAPAPAGTAPTAPAPAAPAPAAPAPQNP